MNVQIKVVGQKLILPDNSYRYISGSRNFIYIVFNLDSDWNNMNVCAEFAQENNVYSYLLDNNNGIHFPSGIEPGVCRISLRGSKDGVTATTDSITLYVDQYSGSDGDVITTYFVDTSEGNVTEDDIPVGKIAFSKGVRIEGKHICNDGITLPEMSDAAYEDDVLLGKEYIDGDGVKRTGKFTIDEELTEQDALITQITDALRNKAANNDPVALPELGDTAAQPTDMAVGKVLYDDEGNPVAGALYENNYFTVTKDVECTPDSGDLLLRASGFYQKDKAIIEQDSMVVLYNIPTTNLGDAKPEDVTAGKTFTSSFGALLEGTHECDGGVELPDLGDTAAQASDIAYGKVLYDDKGNSVTGSLKENPEGSKIPSAFTAAEGDPGAKYFKLSGQYGNDANPDCILRQGATVSINNVYAPVFGTAAASDVVKGKTFTSVAGYLAEGELEEIVAGKPLGANEDVKVSRNSNGTIQILAKTNWGDIPGAIVRSGAYLRITAPESVFDGIFGGTDDVTIDGEALVFGENSTATIENETLIL